jgi:hypothetical protein
MSKRLEKFLLITFAALAIGLGFWGFARAGSEFSQADTFTRAHQYAELKADPVLEPVRCLLSSIGLIRLYDLYQPGRAPWQLIVAQFAVPGIALFSAAQLFLLGVRKNLRTAMARHKARHTIVCGLGDIGLQVVQNLRSAHQRVVAVDLVGDSPGAATCESSGVPVVLGDAKNPQVLAAAGIRHAQSAVICTGSDSENIAIAMQIKAAHQDRLGQGKSGLGKSGLGKSVLAGSVLNAGKLEVLAEMRNDWMHKRLMASGRSSLGSADVDVRLFNPFTNAARMLVRHLHLPPAPEFEARTFIVAGFGAYGREIALHLVRLFPVALGGKLKILILDDRADEFRDGFPVTNPVATELADFEFVKAKVEPGSPEMQRSVSAVLESCGPLLGVALGLGDDEVSLCAALEMRSLLDRAGLVHAPVYVRLEHYRQLGELVRSTESFACIDDRLQIFGTLEETLNREVLFGSMLDRFAEALHDDYRRRSQEQINPLANVPWHALPELMKLSNRWRADHTPLLLELACLQPVRDVKTPAVQPLGSEEIDLLAQLEHRRYTIERRMAQEHNPHIPSWDQLSEAQKQQNREEIARLPQIMAGLGMELHPVRAVRLYGRHLRAAAEELAALQANPAPVYAKLIVDLDEPGAVSAAYTALGLAANDSAKNDPARNDSPGSSDGPGIGQTAMSLWLFSREEPRDFLGRRSRGEESERIALRLRANGWTTRSRVALME